MPDTAEGVSPRRNATHVHLPIGTAARRLQMSLGKPVDLPKALAL